MRILIVDDHDAFRQEVKGVLSRHGHEVQDAATAKEAIPLVEAGGYDFVLVDFNMPEHNGIWFMENVHLPSKTKAILVTAHISKYVINTMFRIGASGYIIKPFDEAELLRHLEFHSDERLEGAGCAENHDRFGRQRQDGGPDGSGRPGPI